MAKSTIVPATVMTEIADKLNDPSMVTWTEANLLTYLNDALYLIQSLRPDAFGVTKVVTLAAGTKQALPDADTVLLDVVRNMGSDGLTPGFPITPIMRSDMDTINRSWHKQTGQAAIDHYMYNRQTDPYTYYVTPPVSAAVVVQVEIVTAAPHTKVTSGNKSTALDIEEVYEPAIKEWMLRQAYLKEVSPQSVQKASGHQQTFFQMLDLKKVPDMFVSQTTSTSQDK